MAGLTLELEDGAAAVVHVPNPDGSVSVIEIVAIRQRSGRMVIAIEAPKQYEIRRRGALPPLSSVDRERAG
jgi:hypothetical protein